MPKPFSHKAKKEQLKAKRRAKAGAHNDDDHDDLPPATVVSASQQQRRTMSADSGGSSSGGGGGGGGGGRGRSKMVKLGDEPAEKPELRSVFAADSKSAVEKKTAQAWKPYTMLSPEQAFEADLEDYYGPNAVIDLPQRPPWHYGMAKATLEENERAVFKAWMDDIYARFDSEQLSYFEHNLEVWRQLWRVVEMSDILLVIVDVRHPIVHFPPALYHWVHGTLKRPVVLVINKIDLVPPDVVRAWVAFFKKRFPELHIATFSCYGLEDFAFTADGTPAVQQGKTKRKRYRRAVGVRDILSACSQVFVEKHGKPVDWQGMVERYSKETPASDARDDGNASDDEGDDDDETAEPTATPAADGAAAESDSWIPTDRPHSDYVTIGLVGHPNVGKSSIINGIMGKTVVSASRTPGHTKHFQTIHLTENVRLSDCPGLVFPSLLPKPVQIISGMYNIAQVREPFSVVQFLAERIPLPEQLDIVHPSLLENDDGVGGKPVKATQEMRHKPHPPWTAWAICEGFALKKGFFTAKAGRPDVHRAANLILRMAFDGRVLLCMKPRGYYAEHSNQAAVAEEIARHQVYSNVDGMKQRWRSHSNDADGNGDEDDEEEEGGDNDSGNQGTRTSNPFALLGNDNDDDDDNNDDEQEDEDAANNDQGSDDHMDDS